MNQPPKSEPPPQWRRPLGVAPGTWDYVHQRSIADQYDAFVADTAICRLDEEMLQDCLPGPRVSTSETVLDLGCGSGRIAIPLAARGYAVVGIDLSQSMLEVMMGNAAKMGEATRQIAAIRANLVELQAFADSVADHAVCMFSTLGMIQGRENRRKMLSHVARIVRRNGRFIVHVHCRWAAFREPRGVGRLARSWIRSVTDRGHELGDATYAYRGIDDMFMHRYSRRELVRDLIATGWSIERVESVSIDGSRVIKAGPFNVFRTGGFIAIARRTG